MPDQKLSAMTAASALTGTELFYADDGSNDVKVTANQIKTFCGASAGLTIGTSAITGGTNGRVLYDNAGVLGELAVTGSGNAVLSTSPTLTTPTLDVATATTINKVAITAPATGSTLTIADGKTLTASNTITLTATDGSTLAIGGGGTLGTAGYANTGTSGGTVPLLNAANTWSANQHIASANSLDWNSDTTLSRFGAGILGLSNSTTGAKLQVYSTTDSTTSPTNYARAYFDVLTASDTLNIGTEHGGSGTAITKIIVKVDGTSRLDYINSALTWHFLSSNVQIGGSGSGTLGIGITPSTGGPNLDSRSDVADNITWGSSTTQLAALTYSGSAGSETSVNFTGKTSIPIKITSGNSIVAFSGITSSFPALKRSSATLQVKLADDSGYGTLQGIIQTIASTTTTAGINLPSGTAPTSPVDGDIWYDGTNLKVRLAGATKTVTVS